MFKNWEKINDGRKKKKGEKQAGAELCQAQPKLGLAKLAFSLLED